MNPLDWTRVDSGAAGRTPDPDQVNSAIARGVNRGYNQFRRRLAARWLVAVTLVAALTAAAFAVRSAVHNRREPTSTQGINGSVSQSSAAVPVVDSLRPASGPITGGTRVTVRGTGLADTTQVTFGTTAADIIVKSDSEVLVVSPAGAPGPVYVTVTTPAGASPHRDSSRFTYIRPEPTPTVRSIVPSSGPSSGGTIVTIRGDALATAMFVRFGTTDAIRLKVISDTEITATSPPGDPGTVHITVTTPNGTSPSHERDQFTYTPPRPS